MNDDEMVDEHGYELHHQMITLWG